MSLRAHKQPRKSSTPTPVRATLTTIALLLISLACLALTACGSAESRAAAEAARRTRAYNQQRAELVDLVNCGRRHGIAMPAPTPNNQIDMRHVNVRGKRRKAALNFCYHQAVKTAAVREKRERAQEESHASPAEKTAAAEQRRAQFQQERSQLLEVVSCAHRHGINLPKPDAHNNINTGGLHIRNHRDETLLRNCFGEVANRASREQQEQARQRESGPVRLGEEPAR